MRYRGNKICPDKRMDKWMQQMDSLKT